MTIMHRELAKGRWYELSFCEQMANIGSEVERTISWKKKGQKAISQNAFWRALELIDFTLNDPKNNRFSLLKEVCRVREMLVDCYYGDNIYQSKDEAWQKYFRFFNLLARSS